jgi:hypothetical protein
MSSPNDHNSHRRFGSDRKPVPIDVTRYEIELAWLGFQSFLKLPICLTPALLKREITLNVLKGERFSLALIPEVNYG